MLPDLARYATWGQIIRICKDRDGLLGNANRNESEERIYQQLKQIVIAKQTTILHEDIQIPDKQSLIGSLSSLGVIQIRYYTAPGVGIAHTSAYMP